MPSYEAHIDCCGIGHAYGFPIRASVETQRDYLGFIDSRIRAASICPGEQEGRLLELTLIDEQLQVMAVFSKGLKERGFKLVSRFKNSNSGNYVNVLHLRPHNRLHGSPYWKED